MDKEITFPDKEPLTVTSRSPEGTFALGRKLGSSLKGGEVILLSGPLGAGKTLFAKGIASALGFDRDEVNSPSFTLVNEYDADLTIYHIDLWRIEDPSNAAFSVGLEELIEEEGSVKVIEWAERIGDFSLPSDTIRVKISGDGDSDRQISISRE